MIQTAEMSQTVGRAASISRFVNFFLTKACVCLLLDGYSSRCVEQLLRLSVTKLLCRMKPL